jgi:hypothetical protein
VRDGVDIVGVFLGRHPLCIPDYNTHKGPEISGRSWGLERATNATRFTWPAISRHHQLDHGGHFATSNGWLVQGKSGCH